MAYQAEAGTQCPLTMTYACIPVFMRHATPQQAVDFPCEPRATCLYLSPASFSLSIACLCVLNSQCRWQTKACVYDSNNAPLSQKRGMTVGMSMTERQGGSVRELQCNSNEQDVRANTTVATPLGSETVPPPSPSLPLPLSPLHLHSSSRPCPPPASLTPGPRGEVSAAWTQVVHLSSHV